MGSNYADVSMKRADLTYEARISYRADQTQIDYAGEIQRLSRAPVGLNSMVSRCHRRARSGGMSVALAQRPIIFN